MAFAPNGSSSESDVVISSCLARWRNDRGFTFFSFCTARHASVFVPLTNLGGKVC